MQIDIIGAGMAGPPCGKRLSSHEHRVGLFDKEWGGGPHVDAPNRDRVGIGFCDFGLGDGGQGSASSSSVRAMASF
jgi:predicted NAD/FAD-dependent oxidoreductase